MLRNTSNPRGSEYDTCLQFKVFNGENWIEEANNFMRETGQRVLRVNVHDEHCSVIYKDFR
jgi:hypothetical protein